MADSYVGYAPADRLSLSTGSVSAANLNSTSFTGTPTNVVDAVSALSTTGFSVAMAVALG